MSLSVVLNWHVNSTRITTKERNPSEMFTYYLFVVFISTHHSKIAMTEICVLVTSAYATLLAKTEIKYSCELSNFVTFDAIERNETKYVFDLKSYYCFINSPRVRFFSPSFCSIWAATNFYGDILWHFSMFNKFR